MSMEHNLNNFIEELIQEVEQELEEATTSGNVAGYNTPFAFGNKRKKDKKKEKETATQAGYTIAEAKDEINSKQLLKIQSDIRKINPRIRAKISTHPATKGRLTISIPEDGNWEGNTEKVTKVVKKHTGDHRTGIIMYEGIIQDREKVLKNLKQGGTASGGGYGTFKKTGRDTFVSPKGKKYNSSALIKLIGKFGDFKVNESINEAKVKRPVNRWLELKNDESMHPHKKMAMGLKELKYQLREVEKFFSWYNKIKTMNELDSQNYWKRTNNHIYKIKERLINIAKTIKEIEK